MKKTLFLIALIPVSIITAPAQIIPRSPYEQEIEKIIGRMTLEEKVGQTAQFTIDMIGKGSGPYDLDYPFELDLSKMDEIFGVYKAGSILNVPRGRAVTQREWNKLTDEIYFANERHSPIPIVYGVDAVHGVSYTAGATFFPQPIGIGATFNRDIAADVGRVTAYEMRACGIHWNFCPVLDLGRDPRWARQWETYSEDVYLVSELGKAYVLGHQGNDPNHMGLYNAPVSLKHFCGYGLPYSGKDRTPAYIPEHELREKHFEPFRQAINAGALSVMANSGLVNGVSTHADYKLLTEWLKEGLEWDGVIISDWADLHNLYRRDRIAADDKQAIKLSVNAGIDMAMIPYDTEYCRYYAELVQEGEIAVERLDDAVRRILRMKFRLGMFDDEFAVVSYEEFSGPRFRALALSAAHESITLLKNENDILPLPAEARVLVTGPNANTMRTLNGGWSYSWQGDIADDFKGDHYTILEAIRNVAGYTAYSPGIDYKMDGLWWEEQVPDFESAIRLADGVDYIIVCVGENSYCEKPGDLDDLYLSDNQQELVRRMAATGKPVIMVLGEGRPRIVSKIEPLVAAVVQTYLPGNFGADALADILWGKVNPSGRLPYTYPKYPNTLFTYDYKPSENQEKMEGAYDYQSFTSVQWPFGYGLSYTSFEYSDFEVNTKTFGPDDTLHFSITVTNTGDRAGKDAVMLFSSDLIASISPDNRRLRGFGKVDLKPGESDIVQFQVHAHDLGFVNIDGRWTLEPGDFMMQAGDKVMTITLTEGDSWL